jgi:hypothetical protein
VLLAALEGGGRQGQAAAEPDGGRAP